MREQPPGSVHYSLLGEGSDHKAYSKLLSVAEPHRFLAVTVSRQLNQDDCLFSQNSNFKYFHSIYLLMPSCKRGLIARPFLQNTTATPTKIIPKTCSASLLPAPKVHQGEGSSCCPSLIYPQSPFPLFLHQQLKHSNLATLASLNRCLRSSFPATIL